MPELSSLVVEVTPKGILITNEQLEKLTKTSKETEKQTSTMMDKFKNMQTVMQGPVAAFNAVSAGMKKAYAVAADLVGEFAKSEQALSNLESVLRSTGGTAGKTSQQLQDMARSLQDSTLFDDDAIIQMNSVLLGFRSISGDTFDTATQAILDMSQVMGTDLVSGAQMLGKALDDPVQGISALSRVGFVFTDNQKKVIKSLMDSGQVMEAQNIILGEMEKAFGGAAKAAGETATGGFIKLGNAIGDLKESWGEFITMSAQSSGILKTIQDFVGRQTGQMGISSLIVKAKAEIKGSTDGSDLASTFIQVSSAVALADKDMKAFIEEYGYQGASLTAKRAVGELRDTLGELETLLAAKEAADDRAMQNEQRRRGSSPSASTSVLAPPSENALYADKVLADMREALRIAELEATLRGEKISDEERLNIIISARLKLKSENVQSIGLLESEIELLVEKLRIETELANNAPALWTRSSDGVKIGGGKDFSDQAKDLTEAAQAAELYKKTMDDLKSSLISLAGNTGIELFKSIGEYIGAGAEGAQSFAESMSNIGMQILNQLPQMLFYGGIQLLGTPAWEVGVAMIAASGLIAIGAGIAKSATNSASNAVPNAMGGVYSSKSLSSYSGGVYDSPQMFAFARGGVFAEAGPEAIMPLSRGANGKLGVRAEGAGSSVSIVINNNAPNTQATAAETVGADGSRQIMVMVESTMRSALASGKMDTVMSRYGVAPQGRRS